MPSAKRETIRPELPSRTYCIERPSSVVVTVAADRSGTNGAIARGGLHAEQAADACDVVAGPDRIVEQFIARRVQLLAQSGQAAVHFLVRLR